MKRSITCLQLPPTASKSIFHTEPVALNPEPKTPMMFCGRLLFLRPGKCWEIRGKECGDEAKLHYQIDRTSASSSLALLLTASCLDGSPGFLGPKSGISLWTRHRAWMTRGRLEESWGKPESQHLFGGKEEERTKRLFLIRWLDIWRDWILAQSPGIAFLPSSGIYGWARQPFCVFPDLRISPGSPGGHYMCDWRKDSSFNQSVTHSFIHSFILSFIHWNRHLEKHCSIMERICLWIKSLALPYASSVTLVKPLDLSEPQLEWIKVTSTYDCQWPWPGILG